MSDKVFLTKGTREEGLSHPGGKSRNHNNHGEKLKTVFFLFKFLLNFVGLLSPYCYDHLVVTGAKGPLCC